MKIALDYRHCLIGADTGLVENGYKEQYCTINYNAATFSSDYIKKIFT